jgi:hypothetical protein
MQRNPHVRRNDVEMRRARIVLAAALKHRCLTVAELRRVPEVSLWRADVLDTTIDALIDAGHLVDSAGPDEPLLVLQEGHLL